MERIGSCVVFKGPIEGRYSTEVSVHARYICPRSECQRAVRQMSAKGAGLKAEINDLAQRQVITRFLKEWAD